jgi:hypothetical protein
MWLLGFVNAANVWNELPELLANTDAAALELWVDHYCQSHPLDTVANAATIAVFDPYRDRSGCPKVWPRLKYSPAFIGWLRGEPDHSEEISPRP